MTSTYEVRNARALLLPELEELLRAAVASEVLMTTHSFDELAEEMLSFVTDPRNFMIVGEEGGQLKSVILGYEPNSRLFPYPTIVMFYNRGSRKLLNAMKQRLLDMLVTKGYTRLMAVNGTKRADAPYLRLMKIPGVAGYKVGSLMMFEVEDVVRNPEKQAD